ncbi:MAG: hypothetical protein EHM72_19975 [Calditrichaeota bacterium]|nr:MAG: hypothetical protein EHM72_19975 [Calditrichota bacterium]
MTFETIDEPIEVITYFDKKQMKPIRFRWRDRAYRVAAINGIWYDIKGRNREYHFHVATRESGSFELIYDSGDFVWKLGRVCLDD